MKKIKKPHSTLFPIQWSQNLAKGPFVCKLQCFFFFFLQGVVGQILGESGMTGSTMTYLKSAR